MHLVNILLSQHTEISALWKLWILVPVNVNTTDCDYTEITLKRQLHIQPLGRLKHSCLKHTCHLHMSHHALHAYGPPLYVNAAAYAIPATKLVINMIEYWFRGSICSIRTAGFAILMYVWFGYNEMLMICVLQVLLRLICGRWASIPIHSSAEFHWLFQIKSTLTFPWNLIYRCVCNEDIEWGVRLCGVNVRVGSLEINCLLIKLVNPFGLNPVACLWCNVFSQSWWRPNGTLCSLFSFIRCHINWRSWWMTEKQYWL